MAKIYHHAVYKIDRHQAPGAHTVCVGVPKFQILGARTFRLRFFRLFHFIYLVLWLEIHIHYFVMEYFLEKKTHKFACSKKIVKGRWLVACGV